MPQKQAKLMSYGPNENLEEICTFIRGAGILLDVRDMKDKPLSVDELKDCFGHNPLNYFINQASSEFTKLGLDEGLPERQELLQLMSENPGLLRQPIVKTSRLVTCGCNKAQIAKMLQINRNGDAVEENIGNRGGRITRRSLPARK